MRLYFFIVASSANNCGPLLSLPHKHVQARNRRLEFWVGIFPQSAEGRRPLPRSAVVTFSVCELCTQRYRTTDRRRGARVFECIGAQRRERAECEIELTNRSGGVANGDSK